MAIEGTHVNYLGTPAPVQYDNVSEILGINTRLQWIPKAGQEGFIVFNYNMEDTDKDNDFKALTADFSVKFKYTFRY